MSMRKTLRWIIVGCGLFFIVGAAAATWRYLSKPSVVTIAVGPVGFEDADLMAAFARALTSENAAVRLSIVATSGPVEALERLRSGAAQLAVMRSDGAASDRVRALAILRSDPVAIVAPEKPKIENFGDLKGKVLGVIGPPGANDALLTTLRRHYGAAGETRVLPVSAREIAEALGARRVDALLFVAPVSRGASVGESWAAVRTVSRRKLAFIGLDDAESIAAASPAYEAGEIPAGLFGGSPANPAEAVTTIQVATYLVADRTVSNDVITRLTRSLFEQRQRLAADVPAANLIKAASTDKDAVVPVHPGAKAYFDGEETTFMERYGDWAWYGPMLIGALGSVLVAVRRFLEQDGQGPPLLPALGEVMAAIDDARSTSELQDVRARVDTTVARLAAMGIRGDIEQERTAVIALALNYINHKMAERRDALLSEPGERARSAAE
jgi:TRAP transporter TAXI family solute receptor